MRQHAAAVVFPGFPGLVPPDWVRRRAAAGLGGVVLFGWNCRDPEQVAALTAVLRAERDGLLVAIDEEGGDVTRLEAARGSSYPGNLALGAVDDVELTERVAAAIASDLARAGVTMNLAPVADANTNPRNPVIGVRSFGADPELVARHVAAFVRGTQRQGVVACAKHFPGHGDTSVDSHRELATVEGELELAPFRAAIGADVRAVMPGHLRVPAYGEAPASLNRRLVSGLLRGELGFGGLVFTDALEMRAVSGTVGVVEGAVQALAAGCDALCLGHDLGDEDVEAVERGIVDAVRDGRLPEERLAEAARRVEDTARWAAGAHDGVFDPLVGVEAARRAIRVDGDVCAGRAPLVVQLVPEANIAAGELVHGLGDLLPGAQVLTLRGRPGVLPPRDGRRLVLVLKDAARHAWQREALEEILGRRPGAIVVETGLPGTRPDGAAGYLCTNGAGRANLEAAAERLRCAS